MTSIRLYEPRCLWDYLRFAADPFTGFDRERYVVPIATTPGAFYNGERYPIEIHEIAVSPVNVFEWAPRVPTPSLSTISAALFHSRITVSLRGRTATSRFSIPLTSFAWKYGGFTAVPRPNSSVNGAPSSAYGMVLKKFRRPFVLPQQGAVEVRLSAVRRPDPPVRATVAWYDAGDKFGGAARFVDFPIANLDTLSAGLYGGPLVLDAPDPFGAGGNNLWPPEQVFSANAFRAQSPVRHGPQTLYGLGVMIEQIAHDDDALSAGFGSPAPIAFRCGSRVRSVDGASLRDWWRPGAPLSITHTDIGPAMAFELPQPLTLLPEDALDVEFELRQPRSDASRGVVSIAVGFNGHALIDG